MEQVDEEALAEGRGVPVRYAAGMTHEELTVLLDYHYWARDRLLDAVDRLGAEEFHRDLGNSFGSVRDTLVHLVSAEWIWCSRWEGQGPSGHLPTEDFETVQDVRARWNEEERRVRDFVSRLGPDGVGRVLEYAPLGGRSMRSVFWQMLQHVVNHASYHRGQVTTMLRQLGSPPPKSQDLITFYRECGRVPADLR